MANPMKLAMFVGGCATAGVVALTAASFEPARAAGSTGSRALQIENINVAQGSGVPANQIVEISFNQAVDPATVGPATLQVRGKNATQTGYTKQVFGSIQVTGNVVRFYPRLPTHLRDAAGKFYPTTSALDDAAANAGFKPSTGYEVRLIGHPAVAGVKSTSGKILKNTGFARFTTAAQDPAEKLWTTQSYSDSPPPQFSFSNPPDTTASAAAQYATHGGTQDVPNSILLSLFCTKVPLAPGTARNQGNVEMTMLARKSDYTLRRPVSGSVFVEQNFDTTLLAFSPRVSLADVGTYSLRVGKGVKDLTEQNDFAVNRQRSQLRQMYDFLAAARALSPGVPVSQLPDPPAELTADWPPLTALDVIAARGVLKKNLLALGDTYPDEIDPRTMLIFTTRDEPVTQDSITVEFTKSEGLYDAKLSTGEVDAGVPSAASAVFTFAGGSAVLGDLLPALNTSISADSFAGGQLNYRNIVIPANVIVTLTGTKPATLLSLSISINGEIRATGVAGESAQNTIGYTTQFSTATSLNVGGGGGPGGGKGGNCETVISTAAGHNSDPGTPGNDSGAIPASAQAGGRGGLGGGQATGNAYGNAGSGGGGGGIRTAGTGGANGTAPYPSWSGTGGAGGAAALDNATLTPLVGGAGGGGGGNGAYVSIGWGEGGAGGGGGGGALTVQTAGVITIGTNGAIRANGGVGGNGSGAKNWSAGNGGGGGGGSILLRTARGYNIANTTLSLDVTGGAGGKQSGSYTSPTGGNGGAGLLRTEDPNGGASIPGATQGKFDPMGAGVPSYVYTGWVDLGVQDPRLLPYTAGSIVTTTENDAIYVQGQMTKESAAVFGTPDTTKVNAAQNSTDTKVTSIWTPLKIHDLTGVVGGAFTPTLGPIAGLPANPPTEYASFDISNLNGKGYRFIRFRIYFQLDSTQTAASLLPSVDRIVTTFQFNF